jgi:hypothetical protein
MTRTLLLALFALSSACSSSTAGGAAQLAPYDAKCAPQTYNNYLLLPDGGYFTTTDLACGYCCDLSDAGLETACVRYDPSASCPDNPRQ